MPQQQVDSRSTFTFLWLMSQVKQTDRHASVNYFRTLIVLDGCFNRLNF